MSSRKITKKVVVKPVPAKKKEEERGSWIAVGGSDYLQQDNTSRELISKEFENLYGDVPDFVYKISNSYEVTAATKHVFTEIGNA